MSAESQIPVGTVCAMFGLNPNTVRTWERRYQFPSPIRNAGGHRAYSAEDIHLISRIVALMKTGISPAEAISKVITGTREQDFLPESPHAQAAFEQILQSIEAHDISKVNELATEAQLSMGYDSFIEDLAFPILARLGTAWEKNGFGVAAEHLFTLTVKSIILERLHAAVTAADLPIITMACVPEEQHQLPLLHLATLLAHQGVARPLVLTGGLPIEETLAASKRASARLIILSATVAPPSTATRAWIQSCIEAGWAHRIILAGPGYFRSRVYAKYPVRAAAANFQQTIDILKQALQE